MTTWATLYLVFKQPELSQSSIICNLIPLAKPLNNHPEELGHRRQRGEPPAIRRPTCVHHPQVSQLHRGGKNPAMSTTFLSIDKFQINLNRLENGCFLDDLEKILTFKMTLLYQVFASFEFISRSQNEVKWSASSLMGIHLNPYSSLKCVQLDKSCHSHALICFP